ncbi:MAG TPA: hypothetical protein VFP61_16360 [Acidimicrobiales bacterium]|nr:hypothetical protein [Acidimicrobiales bacterium]
MGFEVGTRGERPRRGGPAQHAATATGRPKVAVGGDGAAVVGGLLPPLIGCAG